MMILLGFAIGVLFCLKGYYRYKFLILDELKLPDGFLDYLSNPKFKHHKNYSLGFAPITSSAKNGESREAKQASNSLLVIVYVLIGVIICLGWLYT